MKTAMLMAAIVAAILIGFVAIVPGKRSDQEDDLEKRRQELIELSRQINDKAKEVLDLNAKVQEQASQMAICAGTIGNLIAAAERSQTDSPIFYRRNGTDSGFEVDLPDGKKEFFPTKNLACR